MDRRRYPRLKIELDVDVTSEHNFYSTHTRDISEGGLFVDTDTPLPVGTKVQVQLNLDGLAIEADARVAWQFRDAHGRVDGLGLRFQSLGEQALEAIRWFMLRREPMIFDDTGAVEQPAIPRPPPLPKRS